MKSQQQMFSLVLVHYTYSEVSNLIYSTRACFTVLQSYDGDDYAQAVTMNVGSFPKDFGYGADEYDADCDAGSSPDQQPRILLMGLRRSA